MLRSWVLDAATGATIFIKPEALQRTGSFKFRGALNRLIQLQPEQKRAGVVAFSSGNHAQGVAAAAQLLDMPAVIVMPGDAPALKISNTRSYGAEVILYDRASEDRVAIGARLSAERGAVLVPPFDDPDIIAGQGMAGLELAQDVLAAGATLDQFIVCCGGGGLASGTGLAIRHHFPDAELILVEPEHYDDVSRSLAGGVLQPISGFAPTLCDSLQTIQASPLTFGLMQALGYRGVVVSEAEVKAAVRFAFQSLKLVVEPGGAVALAAVLAGKVAVRGQKVGLVLSGGNVDPAVFAAILEG